MGDGNHGAVPSTFEDALRGWEPKTFHRGAIVRVRMINFMTYDDTEFFPGPRLNLVIGANGSGKSTIVCALALGLGGTTKVMDRASSLDGFIKNGAEQAIIEVELFEPRGENAVVRRTIDRGERGNKRSFYLNKEQLTPKAFRQRIHKEYSIQVDNLCQFLPQDKVASFSRLTKEELLEETIRAGRGEDCLKERDQLTDERAKLLQASTNAEADRRRLEEKRRERDRLEATVNAIKEREENERQLQRHKVRLLVLQFEEAHGKVKEARERTKQLKSKVKAADALVQARTKLLNEHKERLRTNGAGATNQEEVEAESRKSAVAMRSMSSSLKSVNAKSKALEDAADALRAWKAGQEESELRLKLAKQDLESAMVALENFNKDNGSQQSINAKRQEAKKLIAEENKVKTKLEIDNHSELGRQKDLERTVRTCKKGIAKLLENAESDDSILRRIPGWTGDLARKQWSQFCSMQKAGEITGKVYFLPLHLSSRDPRKLFQLEKVMGGNLYTFVTTNAADRSKITKIKGSYVLNVDESRAAAPPKRTISKADLDRIDAWGFLDEFIDCDPVVRQAICDLGKVDKVICGWEGMEKKLSALNDRDMSAYLGYQLMTCDRIRVVKKRFNSHETYFTISEIQGNRGGNEHGRANDKRPRVLGADTASDDKEEIDKLQKREQEAAEELKGVQAKIEARNRDLQECAGRLNEHAAIASDLLKLLTAQERLEVAKNTAAQEVTRREREAARDPGESVTRMAGAFTDKFGAALSCLEKVNSAASDILAAQLVLLPHHAKIARMKAETSTLESNLEQATKDFSVLSRELETENSKIAKLKQVRSKFQAELQPHVDEVDDANEIDGGIDEVKGYIEYLKSQIKGAAMDRSAVAEYNRVVEEIKVLEPKVDNADETQRREKEQFQMRVLLWVTDVEKLVDEINNHFKEGFQNVQKNGFHCDGYIELYKVEDNDLPKFGINVYVRFRKVGEFKRLDQNAQSGGERSLATFMYLLALNEVSKVPFRVVDEINQGMDQEKERISFYQLSNKSCGPRPEPIAQYFLVTPKLLNGLRYDPDITVHVVFNGVGALPKEQCNFKRLCEAAEEAIGSKRRRVAAA